MSTTKTRRLDLRLTEEQDALIRRAAEQEAAGRMLEKVKAKFPYAKKK